MTESGKRETPAADAWGALLRTHALLVPRMDRIMQDSVGLPLAWYDVLLELNGAPGRRLRMSDLGDRVVLSRTRVSRLVDDLVRADLVSREANPEDARSAFAVLTPQGRAVFRRAAPIYLDAIDEQFGQHMTDPELRTIRRGLDRLLGERSATRSML